MMTLCTSMEALMLSKTMPEIAVIIQYGMVDSRSSVASAQLHVACTDIDSSSSIVACTGISTSSMDGGQFEL